MRRAIPTWLIAVFQWLMRAIVVVILIASCNFALIRAAPGDPAIVLAGESGATDARFIASVRNAYGLDRSLPEQFGLYVASLARLDLGISHRHGRPVLDLIGERIVPTLVLTVTAFLVSLIAGAGLGLLAAAFQGRVLDALLV